MRTRNSSARLVSISRLDRSISLLTLRRMSGHMQPAGLTSRAVWTSPCAACRDGESDKG